MKKITTFLFAAFILFAFVVKAQVPQKMNYQAVARNTLGQAIANANINVRISILDLSAFGLPVYTETRLLTTNQLGLFTAPIGAAGATSTTGSFTAVDWSTGSKFIKVEADPLGGSNFITLGNNELLSVPYSLYAVNGRVGPAGPANILNIGTVTNTAAGGTASATIIGTSPSQTLNLTLPTGAQGPQGVQGLVGVTGATGSIGLTGLAGATGATGNTGPIGLTGPQGIQGIQGLQGPAGAVNGSGTISFLPKWNTNTTTLSNSQLFDNGTNLGIGTTTPTFKFQVEHSGATGILSKSTAGFSAIDIDGFSGDAALRFAKNGVNQWNIRNRPADDYLEIFELGGGGSRMVIQDATGNVGIGATVAPAYKLDVEHGGSTGIRSKSTAGFSAIDIDGFSGDAALRFAKNGVNQWNIRNNPANDDYQIFELGGGGERMKIQNTTGTVVVNGNFTALGVKAFTMDHPLDPNNKTLMHAAIESNEVLNAYSGNAITDDNGNVIVFLPDYFEAINKDFRYQLTVIGTFAQAIINKEVKNNQFEIETNKPNVKVSWEVKGVRNDEHMKKFPFVAVAEKLVNDKGQYVDPPAYNLPESKRVGYSKSATASSLDDIIQTKITAPKVVDTKGTSLEMIAPQKAVNKNIENVKGTSLEMIELKKIAEKKNDVTGSVAPSVKK